MEKTRLNLPWISNEKSIRETSGKPEATLLLFLPQKAGPTQSATQQPALATKWWAPTTHSGLWSLSPCQLLWAWLPHQTRELKCLWSTLPILSGQTFLLCRNPVRIQCANQGETSQFFHQLSWPFWRNLWVPICWAVWSQKQLWETQAKELSHLQTEEKTMTKKSQHNLKPPCCINRSWDMVTRATDEKKQAALHSTPCFLRTGHSLEIYPQKTNPVGLSNLEDWGCGIWKREQK